MFAFLQHVRVCLVFGLPIDTSLSGCLAFTPFASLQHATSSNGVQA